jgi:hypothetical protein
VKLYNEEDEGKTYINLDSTSKLAVPRYLSPTTTYDKASSVLGFEWRSIRGVEKYIPIHDPDLLKLLLASNSGKANHYANVYRAAGGYLWRHHSIPKIVEFLVWERSHTDLNMVNALMELDEHYGNLPMLCLNHKHISGKGSNVLPQSMWYPRVIQNVLQTLGSAETPNLHIPRQDNPNAWLEGLRTLDTLDTELLFDRVLNQSIRL